MVFFWKELQTLLLVLRVLHNVQRRIKRRFCYVDNMYFDSSVCDFGGAY